ncbi:MAG: molybdopterin oxidoreductase family protein [Microgenomates group bacterium]
MKITSSCIYCGVGCRLTYWVKRGEIFKINGDPTDPISEGKPCLKGLTIHEVIKKNRLVSPQIKVGNEFKKVSWKEALNYIYQQTKDLAPQEVFFSGSGKIPNEDNFIIQKFARLVFQTNNIDNCCSRLCHQATIQAMMDCFGTPNLTWNENLKKIDTLLIIGSNPASNYPVFWRKILEEKAKRKIKIINIQAIFNLTAKQLNKESDLNLIINQGTELVVINGIINYLLKNKKYPPEKEKIEGFERLKNITQEFNLDFVTKTANLSSQDFQKACQIIASSQSLGIFHGMGLTQHVNGIENVHSLLNLVILKNAFLLTQRGEINVQGAGDMICHPLKPTANFSCWLNPIPQEKGKNMIEAFYLSPVKAAFISGFNPAQSLPALDQLKKNLKKMFLVVIDSYFNETTKLAKVVLPAPILIERKRKGTITNGERRVRLINQVIPPYGQSLPEWQIYQQLARFWKKEKFFPYKKEEEIFQEITQVVPDYQKINPQMVYQGKDAFPNKNPKFKVFYPERWEGYDDPRSEKYPFLLTTFRSPYSFLTGEATANSSTLTKMEECPFFWFNPQDAHKNSLKEGEIIEIESTIAKIKGKIKITPDIPVGIIGSSFHSSKLLVNRLFPLEFDEETFTPNFKATAVRINKVS